MSARTITDDVLRTLANRGGTTPAGGYGISPMLTLEGKPLDVTVKDLADALLLVRFAFHELRRELEQRGMPVMCTHAEELRRALGET